MLITEYHIANIYNQIILRAFNIFDVINIFKMLQINLHLIFLYCREKKWITTNIKISVCMCVFSATYSIWLIEYFYVADLIFLCRYCLHPIYLYIYICVCVCGCVCVGIYMCIYRYVCMYVCAYIYIYICVYVYLHIYVCTYVCVYIYIYIYIFAYIYIYGGGIYMCIYRYLCMYLGIYVSIYIYIFM